MLTLLSRYKIIKEIGQGGFGDTYLAEDTALPVNPKCVVKHLKRNPDPNVLAISQRLFENEAKILQDLGKYDQIPALYAYFTENGEFYLVQEFVDGYDLNTEIISGKKLSEKQTIKLLQEILEILAILHQQNIIHRDIKPSNIMRRRSDGKIVLIDFGAVKEIAAFTVNSKGQTSLTVGIGTPGYMPSEQANGKPKFASDIYAVGIIGIQALTGLLPAQLEEDSTTGEIIWRNHAQVSNRFCEVLNNMVRDHFSQRYKNANEALQALIPPPNKTVVVPSTQDFPKKIIVGFGIAVALSFAGGYVINNSFSNQGSPKVSSTSQQTSEPENSLTISPTPEDTSEPENSPAISPTPEPINTNTAQEFFDRAYNKSENGDKQGAIKDYTQGISINPNVAEAYNNRGVAKSDLGDNQAAIADYNQALKINPKYANAYINRGAVYRTLGNHKAAIADYNQAIKINPNHANAYNNRGNAKSDLGDKEAAIADYNQAIKINPNYAEAYYNRGNARDLEDQQAAIVDYNQAIKINPNYAVAYYNRGFAYIILGDKQAAITDFQEAAKLYQQQGDNTWYRKALDRISELQQH